MEKITTYIIFIYLRKYDERSLRPIRGTFYASFTMHIHKLRNIK